MKQALVILILALAASGLMCQAQQWGVYCDWNTVYATVRQGDQYWLGTSVGLVRLNTITGEKQYYHKLNSGLPTNQVNDICLDSQGRKWIGTASGVAVYDDANWVIYKTDNSPLPDNRIHCLKADSQDRIWIGTAAGLACLDDTTWTSYNSSNSPLSGCEVYCIITDAADDLWLGCSNGFILRKTDTDWTTYSINNNANPTYMIEAMAFDQQGNLWVAAYGCGLAKFDGVNWTVYPVPETYDPGGFSAMLVDSYNRVWLSSYWFYVDYPRENYNLYCFEDGFWTLYNEINSSLHGGGVSCMAQDSAGNILLGTVFSGLLMFSGGSWQDYLNINNGLYSNDIHDISFDADGNMWLATALGIAKVSGDIVTTYKEGNSGLTSNYVYAITTDSYNNKWIGTGRGLNVFNENGIVHNPDIPVAQLSPLMSVYPNPFTRVANIRLNFTKSSRYSLSVYNVKGQLVKKLADGAYAKAEDSVTWDGTSDNGSPVSRGIYFLRLQGDGFSQARKVIFLR